MVLQGEATEERGEQARLSVFVGAIAIGDLVKSTLSPRGMDKILQSTSGRPGGPGLQVTNDGATILRALHVDNPAAKVLINLAKVQDEEVGDGTTSVCVLAAELLREAERLVEHQRVHPQTVIAGYRAAAAAAREALERSAASRASDSSALETDLLAIARTTLSSKILAADREHFARLAVDAVLRVAEDRPGFDGAASSRVVDLERIHVLKRTGGRLAESELADGLILDKRVSLPPGTCRVANARVLVANTAMDADKAKVYGGRFRATGPEQLAALEAAERDAMKAKVARIVSTGATVFVNRQLVYNWPEQLLADAGVATVEHADFDGVERLALVTGARIASTFEGDVVLGECALVEEVALGGSAPGSDADNGAVRFSGCRTGAACTIVLRGATPQLLEEAERSLHDALCVLQQTVQDPRTVYGGGCAEMLMAQAVDGLVSCASSSPALSSPAAAPIVGKQMLAVEAFARALRQLPTIIAENAGLDAGELVSQLRVLHAQGFRTAGLDIAGARVGDVAALGVVESLRMKRQVLVSASEAAEMILRVDDIIKAAPRQRHKH